jgi:hypothetical protein
MVLEMVACDQLPAFEANTLAKFRRGDDRERDLLADLTRIGRDAQPAFQIMGQQERFELKDRKGRIAIAGKTDARLVFPDLGFRPPLEVKAWSPQITDCIETFADVFESPWTRPGGYQLLSYLFGSNQPFGFLLLDRSGLPRLLPVELDQHLDRMEDFLSRSEEAIDHQRAGTLPDYLEGEPAECQRCSFYGSTCNPPLSSLGAKVLTDPDLEAELERREELRQAGQEYDRLDKTVKAKLRGVEMGIVGAFVVNGKWSKTSRLELPADVKARHTVTDPKGRFTLEITRL